MYYLLENTLVETDKTDEKPIVAVFSSKEWEKQKDNYPFHIEQDGSDGLYYTKADVHIHSLSGSFSIPDRKDLNADDRAFYFGLNEDAAVFVDDSRYVEEALSFIKNTKKWNSPSQGRLFYDLMDYIVKDDVRIMEKYELELEAMEDKVNNDEQDPVRLNAIRSETRRFYIHYEQLLDLAQEFEENENGYFSEDNLRYFQSYINRVDRLLNATDNLREYVLQVEDMYRDRIAVKQNHIMTLLTVVTTILMPLTLIAGWYGMNFRYMPELDSRWGYPVTIIVSIVIVVVSLLFFKKKKWL